MFKIRFQADTIAKIVETPFIELPNAANDQTQTEGLTFRELKCLDKALQRTHGELVNNLVKLTDIDKDTTKEKRKLGEAENEISEKELV